MGLETLMVEQDFTTLDLLLWRRFGFEIPGAVEKTLARNPAAAEGGPFLPVGMLITIAVDDFIKPESSTRTVVRLWN